MDFHFRGISVTRNSVPWQSRGKFYGIPSSENDGIPSFSEDGIPSFSEDGIPSFPEDGIPSFPEDGIPSVQDREIGRFIYIRVK